MEPSLVLVLVASVTSGDWRPLLHSSLLSSSISVCLEQLAWLERSWGLSTLWCCQTTSSFVYQASSFLPPSPQLCQGLRGFHFLWQYGQSIPFWGLWPFPVVVSLFQALTKHWHLFFSASSLCWAYASRTTFQHFNNLWNSNLLIVTNTRSSDTICVASTSGEIKLQQLIQGFHSARILLPSPCKGLYTSVYSCNKP